MSSNKQATFSDNSAMFLFKFGLRMGRSDKLLFEVSTELSYPQVKHFIHVVIYKKPRKMMSETAYRRIMECR